MSKVISNTSPLQYLHQIKHLHLLPALFGCIIIPKGVQQELEEGRRQGISVPDPIALSWIEVWEVEHPALLPLVKDLGQGETEVLALALENPGHTVIIDDRLGRKMAQAHNIPLVGTLGVLLKAKSQGLVSQVEPLIHQLNALGFRLHPKTQQAILKLAGEKTEN